MSPSPSHPRTYALTGKFHSHLTICPEDRQGAELAARKVGGKLTVIENMRPGGEERTDWIITHHYVTGYRDLTNAGDVLNVLKSYSTDLLRSGIPVIRVKLEHEMLDPRSDPQQIQLSLSGQYTEVHVKCKIAEHLISYAGATAAAEKWHMSRNSILPANMEPGFVMVLLTIRYPGQTDTIPPQFLQIDDLVRNTVMLTQALRRDVNPDLELADARYESAVYDSNEAMDDWWMQ